MSESETTDDRDYEVTMTDGRKMHFRIPSTYRVTFGPLTIASKGGAYNNQQLVLRVYEDAAKERQRMLLTGVAEFRDLSIPILVEAARRPGDKEWFDPTNELGPIKNYDGDRSLLEWKFVPEDQVIGLETKKETVDDDEDPDEIRTYGSKPGYRSPRTARAVAGKF